MKSRGFFVLALFAIGLAYSGEFDPPDIEVLLSKEEFMPFARTWRLSAIDVTEEGHLILPGKPELLAILDELNIPYRVSQEREAAKHEADWKGLHIPSSYFDPSSFETWVTDLVADHSAIARLIQVGTSVENRPLWAIKISDNPDAEEFEPEMRIIGNIHGDEKSSLMVCTDLMEWILTQYGTDPQATRLVDESEMWFMPMVNPDGNVSDDRNNANSVDLNRNFDGPEGNDPINGGTAPFSEPETKAVRSLSETYQNVFVLGLSFHSGAACFNSVWNFSSSEPLPDLGNFFSSRTGGSPCGNFGGDCAVPAPYSLSEAYQDGCSYPDFWNVFGADWYPTWGDTNDWAYYFESTLDTTIEVTYPLKTPSDDQIPIYTQQHRMGAVNYLSKVFQGIEGIVTDSLTSSPIQAEVTVGSFPKAVSTDLGLGDYHRFCVPGTYSMTVSAPGYLSTVINSIVVEADALTRVDVQLFPDVNVTYAELFPYWPGPGPFDANANQRVDVVDLVILKAAEN